MKAFKILVILFVVSVFTGVQTIMAQCAMCSAAVESNNKNGGISSNGLNHGIVYLLAAPYIAVAAIGFIWYKKYRRKNVNINMRDEKLHLN